MNATMSTLSTTPAIETLPQDALVDQEIRIQVRGLNPNQSITVHAFLQNDQPGISKDVFESYAHYVSDNSGIVDFHKHAAVGGLYSGIEAMGLFWSMIPSPKNQRKLSRLTVKDVEKPVVVTLSAYIGHLIHDEIEDNDDSLCTTKVRRWYKHHDVKREPVRVGRLRGTVFVPPGKGPFPGVIDLFGTAGGLMEFRASLLASHGFLTFALAYFDFEDLPTTAMDLDLEYFEEAKDFLLSRRAVMGDWVGIVGVSVGGNLALATTTYVPGVKCAVILNGPVLAQYVTISYKGRVWDGKLYDFNQAYVEDSGVVLADCLNDHYCIKKMGSSLIEFHKSPQSFLFIFCDDDKALNHEYSKKHVRTLLNDNSVCKCETLSLPGAGHLLEPPYSPHAPVTYTKLFNSSQKWGGNARQHAEAQLKAWRHMIKFLRDCFRVDSKL